MIDKYKILSFIDEEGNLIEKTICEYTTEELYKRGLQRKSGLQQVAGINIFPSEYFSPRHYVTKHLKITANTRAIHHCKGSWTNKSPLKKFLRACVPEFILIWNNRIKKHKDWIK